jgi:hypothetical protein
VSLKLSGTCDVIYSRSLISVDGKSWQELPFAERSPTGRDSAVFAAVAAEGGLLLVGESSQRAGFWLGEVP